MKTFLAYKNQVQGFRDVLETVKTVEKIAASSIHFLKQKVYNLNIYASEIERVLARLSLFYQKKNNPLLKKRTKGKKALVILTGNKGLVGGLWHQIINSFLENLKPYQAVIAVGAKGENMLKQENIQNIAKGDDDMEHITNYVFDEFKKGAFSQIDILYPQFISLAEQKPNFTQFLPFEFELDKEKENDQGLPIFEPSKEKIFNRLLRKYISIFFYKIIMETKLSELSARTVAMEHASVKTNEFIQKFTLDYVKNQRRLTTQKQLESFAVHQI
jgi:F-type H+-transporting ATPase subunit gamma